MEKSVNIRDLQIVAEETRLAGGGRGFKEVMSGGKRPEQIWQFYVWSNDCDCFVIG